MPWRAGAVKPGGRQGRSFPSWPVERRGAEAPEAAGFAHRAGPDRVETLLHAVEQDVVVGGNSHLEVAAALAFCAEARAREVGAAEVEVRAVDSDHLEVDARAKA